MFRLDLARSKRPRLASAITYVRDDVAAVAELLADQVVVNDDRTVTDRYVELAAGEVEAMAAQLR